MLARLRNSTSGSAQGLDRHPGFAIEGRLSMPLPVQKKPLSAELMEHEPTPTISPTLESHTFVSTANTRKVRAADGGDANSLLGNLRISLSAVGTSTVGHGQVEEIERSRHLSLFCVISGSGQICVCDDVIEAAAGTVVFVPREREVALRASAKFGSDFVVSTAQMAIDLGRGFSLCQTLEGTVVNQGDTTFSDLNVFDAFEEVLAGSFGAHAIAEALLTIMVIKTLCAAVADAKLDERMRLTLTHPGIARVLNSITNNPGEDYTVQNLADIAGLTRHQLSQMFDEIFAQTPAIYLKSVRLKLAESLLLDTRQPVKTIAGIVGYSSRSHFSRTFRAHHGVDPTEYRQMRRIKNSDDRKQSSTGPSSS